MLLPVLSPETVRCVLRLDDIDEVRWTLGAGDEGCDSRVLRRDDGGSGTDLGVRPERDRCGSSVLEEFALELPRLASRAPCREGGGGGGDFAPSNGSTLLGTGLCKGSIECWEDMVRFELLRDLLPVVVVLS
jgi:hypothetical protein